MSLFGIDGATSISKSGNSSQSISQSQGATYGSIASAQALSNMREANAYNTSMWNQAAQFNAEQAAIQRAWQEKMSNTTYQRTVKDMIKAGINPILAAGAGLGADTIGSGATASIGAQSGAMASATPDSITSSYGASEGHGWGMSESESGLAKGLELLGQNIANAISTMNSSNTIEVMMDNLGGKAEDAYNDLKKMIIQKFPNIANYLGLSFDATPQTPGVHRKKEVTGSAPVGSKTTPKPGSKSSSGGTHF